MYDVSNDGVTWIADGAQDGVGAQLMVLGRDQELEVGAGADGERRADTEHLAGILGPLDAIAQHVPDISCFLNGCQNANEVQLRPSRGLLRRDDRRSRSDRRAGVVS